MTTRARSTTAALTGALLLAVATPSAYELLTQSRWRTGATVTMDLQLPGGGTLIDGATSWNVLAAKAIADWNYWLGSIDFVSRVENRSRLQGNNANDVFFADDVYGDAFGPRVLAVTTSMLLGAERVEADVIFNRAISWNSYRGPLRNGISDFRRVALHEFGHVLELGHPDDAGQSVDAIMNRATSGTDDLQTDDVQGVRALYPYGNPPQPPASSFPLPTRAEAIDFRHLMEARSRNRGDAAKPTFVDIDASAIWNAEYIRYRVYRCTDAVATDRVVAQIEGRGIQPVCGAPASISRFPSFGDNDRFRAALEREYRDVLKSTAREYHVDADLGAWQMREYVWLRMTGLTHPQAVTRLTTPGFVPAPWPPVL